MPKYNFRTFVLFRYHGSSISIYGNFNLCILLLQKKYAYNRGESIQEYGV
jgi:hypothetical protein